MSFNLLIHLAFKNIPIFNLLIPSLNSLFQRKFAVEKTLSSFDKFLIVKSILISLVLLSFLSGFFFITNNSLFNGYFNFSKTYFYIFTFFVLMSPVLLYTTLRHISLLYSLFISIYFNVLFSSRTKIFLIFQFLKFDYLPLNLQYLIVSNFYTENIQYKDIEYLHHLYQKFHNGSNNTMFDDPHYQPTSFNNIHSIYYNNNVSEIVAEINTFINKPTIN